MASRVLLVTSHEQEGTSTTMTTTEDAPKPTLWLLLDTETTGLLRAGSRGERLVVLEVAWMVVDGADLTQLTPLRQRITAIWELPGWRDRVRAWSRLQLTSSRPVAWSQVPMDPEVRAMHEKTRLARDWERVAPIRDVGVLDELIGADIETARTKVGDPEARVHLGGAGVAQFEARLLPRSGSKLTDGCHYRCADTSVASMVTGVPKVGQVSWEGVTSVDLQSGIAAAEVEHRAAGDVLRAYGMARRLRGLGDRVGDRVTR